MAGRLNRRYATQTERASPRAQHANKDRRLLLGLIRGNVCLEFFPVGIFWFLLEKLFIFVSGFVFHAGAVVKRSQEQVSVRLSGWIQFQRLVEITHCL